MDHLMSRRGALKALHRLADAGIFSLRSGTGDVRIGRVNHSGKITLIHVSGSDIPSIVDGFLRRAGHPAHPTVYVVGTEHSTQSRSPVVMLERERKNGSRRSA